MVGAQKSAVSSPVLFLSTQHERQAQVIQVEDIFSILHIFITDMCDYKVGRCNFLEIEATALTIHISPR